MAHYIIYFECIEGFKNRYAPLFLMFIEKYQLMLEMN